MDTKELYSKVECKKLTDEIAENDDDKDNKLIDALVLQNAAAKSEWEKRLNEQAAENMRSKLKIELLECIKPHWKLEWKRKIMEMVQGMTVTLITSSDSSNGDNHIDITFPNLSKTKIRNSLDKLGTHIFLSTAPTMSIAVKITSELDGYPDDDEDDFFLKLRNALGQEMIPFNIWWDVVRVISQEFTAINFRPSFMTTTRRQDNVVFVYPQHYNRELFTAANKGQFGKITLGSWHPVPWDNQHTDLNW